MGKGVQRNSTEGLRWLRTAALHGSVVAQMLLANVYIRGDGVPADIEAAKRWLFMASNSVDPRYRPISANASKLLARIQKSGTAGLPGPRSQDSVSVPPLPVATEPASVHSAATPEKSEHMGSSDDGVISGSILYINPTDTPPAK